MSDADDIVCRRHVTDAGYSARTPLILSRERARWETMVNDLTSGSDDDTFSLGEPMLDEPEITLGRLVEVLSGSSGKRGEAAYVAGRVTADDEAALSVLDEHLAKVASDLEGEVGRASSSDYVHAAMAQVLRGDGTGRTRIEAVVADDDAETMGHLLAIYCLAQLDDPSGYPKLLAHLDGDDEFTTLLAARYLAAFLPYDGQEIGGHTVEVVARLADHADDDEIVAQEIPGLIAETGAPAARETLQRLAKKARRSIKKAAKSALEVLDEG